MTPTEIKKKIAGLAGLPLNLNYEQSGDTSEIQRVTDLVFSHFGITNKPSVSKSYRFPGCEFDFRLDGELITSYRVYDCEGKMGVANVTMCIQDLIVKALCMKDLKNAPEIAEMFDPWIAKIAWNYNK